MNLVVPCNSIKDGDGMIPLFEGSVLIGDSVPITGFQLNIIEQWLASRHPHYQSVVVYTGNPSHTLDVSIYQIPNDSLENTELESSHIRPLIDQYRADGLKPFESLYGTIYIAILGDLPPILNLIPVPEGNLKRHISAIVSSFNLKRMDCMPRTALIQSTISASALDKLANNYHLQSVSQANGLILLIQVALFLFGELHSSFNMDGVLCDGTLSSLKSFYKIYEKVGDRKLVASFSGTISPSAGPSAASPTKQHHKRTKSSFWEDGNVPPMNQVFAYLLSLLYACKNKLAHALSGSMPSMKMDPLIHPKEFMADIAAFQQEYGLKVSSKLDLHTVELLYDLLIYRRKSIKRSLFKTVPKEEDCPINIETNDLKSLIMSFKFESLNLLKKVAEDSDSMLPDYGSIFRKSQRRISSPPAISRQIQQDEHARDHELESPTMQIQSTGKEKKTGLKKVFMKFLGDITSTDSHRDQLVRSMPSSPNVGPIMGPFSPLRRPEPIHVPTSTTYTEGRYRSNSVTKLSSSDVAHGDLFIAGTRKLRSWSTSNVDNCLFYNHIDTDQVYFKGAPRESVQIEHFKCEYDDIINRKMRIATVNLCLSRCQDLVNRLLERLSLIENSQKEIDDSNAAYADGLDQCQQLHDRAFAQLQQLLANASKMKYDSSRLIEKFKESEEALVTLQKEVMELDQHYLHFEDLSSVNTELNASL